MIEENLVRYIGDSIQHNWDQLALSNYQGDSCTYGEVAGMIEKLHLFYQQSGINQGDKIALVGKNTLSWAITYLATVTYGAVMVPVLADFNNEMILHIVQHSDAVLLFAEKSIIGEILPDQIPAVYAMIDIETNKLLFTKNKEIGNAWEQSVLQGNTDHSDRPQKQVNFANISNEKLAVISYTSGTSGNSKGVMLSHNAIAANIRYAQNNMPLSPGDSIVSFLPLAHAYGCAFEFLFPFTLGCHITFLTKTPSPQIITRAFNEFKPRLILSVPLVIEKIYKKQIVPFIEKPVMKVLLKIPLINRVLYNVILKKIVGVFGGNFHEVVIGGAALNPDAERFFSCIKFPFAIGYGMTECGPLISYAPWDDRIPLSCGRPVDTLTIKIDSHDPENTPGEILVKGENVMDGYYKNEKASRQVIDDEGWLHTGDLGTMDDNQNIFIRGRSKSMILGPSGQNIYPEEIESVLNNFSYVNEALVVGREGKIVALIYPDFDTISSDEISPQKVPEILEEIRKETNRTLPPFMNINRIEIMKEDFERTPKRNIRRFHYN